MSSGKPVIASHSFDIRVRYPEADPMGFLHHSRFLQYFEMGRIELLRSIGHSYATLESLGFLFVVTRVEVRYRAPARFDDLLTLTTKLVRQTIVRLDHEYELKRENTLIAEASTTIACVNREGEVVPIPENVLVRPA